MYKESSLEAIRNADILQIIGRYCPDVKKAGTLYECRSPFSEDRTASFKVSPVKNNFVCYSSQHKGDAIKFVMLKERCSFVEAVRIIGGICNIVLEEEQQTEEQLRVKKNKESMLGIMNNVAREYQKQLQNLPPEHWTQKMIADRAITPETLIHFSIGYAPDDFKFVTTPVIEKGKFEPAKSTGIISVKDGKSYDFFRNRLIFPIQDIHGNVIAFGGRCADDDPAKESGRKYINSKESELYSKSKTLYGIYQAKHAIAKEKTALLVEGYTDVTALHQQGCELAVATGGTALSTAQATLLKRFANHVILLRDNDGYDEKGNEKGGVKATLKDIDILLGQGLKVSVVMLPEGEDPDSFSRKTPNIQAYISTNIQDAVTWKTTKLINKAANDPDAVAQAVTEVAQMLYKIKDNIKRNLYLEVCRKITKQPAKILREKIESFNEKILQEAENKNTITAVDVVELGLPEGADYKEYLANQYVTVGNTCYFRGREGFFKGTNYKITPLFHVYGKSDNKRLCEAVNERGEKTLVDFDTADFVSVQKYEEKLLNEGYFIQLGNFGKLQFNILKNNILKDFIKAYELKTLGWQRKEGFFAYANCVFHNNTIKNVNNYGIVQLETGIKNESEYMEDVKHFYSPAFSEMYKYIRDDDDPYENDRYFVYKQAPVSFEIWMKQLRLVYGKKAITGIAFIFATLFRDIYLLKYQFFPHLFLTREKGSGKSKYGESLVALFTYKQEPFDLNSGTPVAFYRRLSRLMNAPTMLEEYHDNVDDKIFQPLKGAYDGRGREMGKATGDNRTTTTKVNCSLIILSQYLSSRDDNSLTSRSIVEHFIKPQENFTNTQLEHYALLKQWEEKGLSSLLTEIIQHRSLVEDKIQQAYGAINKKMKADLKDTDYQERMLQNYVALLAPIRILWEHFPFPFTYEEIYKQFKDAIIDSSDLIVESEGLAEFWKTIEYLVDRKPYPLVVSGTHFIINKPLSITLQTRKGEKDHIWQNNDRKELLFLRLNAVHQLYHKEVSTREGTEVISENTLRNYFKSKKYFIGAVKSHRFEDTVTSAYVFDYSMMHEGGLLNLVRIPVDKQKTRENYENTQPEEDDLPF